MGKGINSPEHTTPLAVSADRGMARPGPLDIDSVVCEALWLVEIKDPEHVPPLRSDQLISVMLNTQLTAIA
jgi:hypothetical protein